MRTLALLVVGVGMSIALGGLGLPVRGAEMPEPQRMVAFMGVGLLPVNPAEAKGLGLAEGVGLQVRSVDEKSPAQNRINVGDILLRLDDQILIHPHQFAVLVRTYKPGSEVKVSLLRGGNELDLPVVLAAREETPLPYAGAQPLTLTVGQTPGGAIRVNPITATGGVTFNVVGVGDAAAGPGTATVIAITAGEGNRRTTTRVENGTSYTMTTVNGISTFTVTGADGKVLFTGPATTDEEKGKVPDAYRAWLTELNKEPVPPPVPGLAPAGTPAAGGVPQGVPTVPALPVPAVK